MGVQEINQKKVINTKILLKEIIDNPKSFADNINLVSSLNSQSALARYEDKNLNIYPCSLNTLKTASESLLQRGFIELDELRINAKNSFELATKEKKSTTKTRIGLKHKLDEVNVEVNNLKAINLLQSMIIEELRGELKKMVASSDSLEKKQLLYSSITRKLEAELSYISSNYPLKSKEGNNAT